MRPAEETCAPCDPPPDVAPDWYWRFMSKIERPNGVRGCWNWTFPKNEHGYGIFCFKGKRQFAHRFSLEQMCGTIPPGLSVLHGCDNPSCVNPFHLRLGTQIDNNEERDRKGRVAHGERGGNAKLTADQVRTIRAEVGNVDWLAAKCAELGKRYDIADLTVFRIITRTTWRRL